MFSARVVTDSVSPAGYRLTTFVLCYPRFIHAEVMTHRTPSRNASSSRAIPISVMLDRIREDPAMPVSWGRDQKGMRAGEELDHETTLTAMAVWARAAREAVANAELLASLGVHKQIANRIVEPWAWMETIFTATEWSNFFALRLHRDAQPEFRHLARLMRDAYDARTPAEVPVGEWHLPLVDRNDPADAGIAPADLPLVSVGRCARVSYLTHEGKRDPAADVALARRLRASGHMSPFEHVACPMTEDELWDTAAIHRTNAPAWMQERHHMCGNFRGWVQHRKTLPGEAVWRDPEAG